MSSPNLSPPVSPTRYVVGGVMAVAILLAVYAALDLRLGLVAIAFGLYETWTLVNRYPNDTISEIVWQLAERPLVPYLFGCATGWMLGAGLFENHYVAAAWGLLMGHLFWQRFGK